MNMFSLLHHRFLLVSVVGLATATASAQQPDGRPPGGAPGQRGPGGPGGGPPSSIQPDYPLVKQFDKDSNGWLNASERKAALEFVAAEKAAGRGPRRFGPRGGDSTPTEVKPGKSIKPADVASGGAAGLYDPNVVRTLFFEFENSAWEKELMEFYHTDVEVPGVLTVDGRSYPGVGVRFRGASSFFTVKEGLKHSMNISLDLVDSKQRLLGVKTLNLLNSHTDPTFMRSVLYCTLAGRYLPAYRANHVRVVVNGESWGIYNNIEQFNADFTKDRFGSEKGARWKVPGSPRARGNLAYLGDDARPYREIYELKTKDKPESWSQLTALCKTLGELAPGRPTAALEKILDVDGALKFLALENVFINADGYWIRTSDYNLYLDEKGRFHIVPHDSNETFREPEGPGWNASDTKGVELSPIQGSQDPEKPLISKLLAIPAYRQKYLGYIRMMAEDSLDWKVIEPLVKRAHQLIRDDVSSDTRRLNSKEAFEKGVLDDIEESRPRGTWRLIGLKSFADQRRAYLLSHPEVKAARRPSP